MTRPTAPASSLPTFAFALVTSSFLLPALASAEKIPSAWLAPEEGREVSEFLASALPVAGNKSDIENEAPSFFRIPTSCAHEPGTILYVGLSPEQAPIGSPYRTPLFSGSIESFDLGPAYAKPAPQTVGDIGEIYPEDAKPTPMAYVVYRLDFSTRGGEVSLFATPTVTSEPFTTTSPESLVGYAFEGIHFSNFASEDDHANDFKTQEEAPRPRMAPEPTSLALLGLGVLGLATRRRRAARL